MEDKKQEKVPIDAQLLSDAVIELNISRRSVGLYPREHPITRESVEKAFEFLQKIFEIRSSITIGIAKDILLVDEYTLEKKNPVFREFASSLHARGIAAVTFSAGLIMDELFTLHELITQKNIPTGKALLELSVEKGLRRISIAPLDISKFDFIENSLREDGSEIKIWENYIFGLIEGKIADSEAEGGILNIPPEAVADILNNRHVEAPHEMTYDHVITSYLRRKEGVGFNQEFFSRFVSMVQNLGPEMKQQFLKSFSCHIQPGEAQKLFRKIMQEDIAKMMNLLSEHDSIIPDSLRNILEKLSELKKGDGFFDLLANKKGIVDDVEIDENIMGLFSEDSFKTFVSKGYQKELELMLGRVEIRQFPLLEELKDQCRSDILDRIISDVTLEFIEEDSISRKEYLDFLTNIVKMVNDFLETGRFREIIDIYNTLYTHALTGRFKQEASSMLDFSFYSEKSIANIINAFRLWGRHNRDWAVRLAGLLKHRLAGPFFDALAEETDPAIRKFFLSVLKGFRSDILSEAARRLKDERWYVVRNMIYLIRECGNVKYASRVKPFLKHRDKRIGMEALKTFLHFDMPGTFSYVKLYLQSKDLELRDQVIRLIGIYKVKEAVVYLMEILEKRDIFGAELHFKISVVKALGEIGDPRVLDTFMRLYNSQPLFNKNFIEELKIEIFKSLFNYPPVTVKPFFEKGLYSKNIQIRKMSGSFFNNSGIKHGTRENI